MAIPDLQETNRALRLLFQPGETVELRCVGNGPSINGYYRNFDKLAQDACRLNAEFNPLQNVYVCLNPVKPELYGRRADQFGAAKKGEGVKDADVACRRWLLIDIDPVRPQGVSATEAQKRAAEDKAAQVYQHLVKVLQLPAPVCANSGNGCHLLLRLADLPATDETKWICEQFLKRLAEQFNANEVKVDQTTFNAARIGRLYGCVNRKGSDIPEQPHRLARLVHVPDPIQPADLQSLVAVTGPYPGNDQRVQQQPVQAENGWDIDQLLQDRDIKYTKDEDYRTNTGELATRWELEVCPWNAQHNDRSAWIIQWRTGATAAGCHHDGCVDNDWQKLKVVWALPASGGVTAAEIILPGQTAALPVLQSFITPPEISQAAFYGPLGQIVQGIGEDTEGSCAAILACTLMYLGNAVGHRYYVHLDQLHFPKLYIALVGPTATGRKGTADVQARRIIDAIDPIAELYRQSGLSTGEGMLEILDENRDGMIPRPAVFIETEFATVLRRADRRGNTLSGYIRGAWDNEPLSNSAKSNLIRITDHHVSLCVHVTATDLHHLLDDVAVGNGFCNRFLWVYTERSHRKPGACGFRPDKFPQEVTHLRTTLESLTQLQPGKLVQVPFTDEAWQLWCGQLYAELDVDGDEDTSLMLMCSRQPQQVCRIALIFALVDGLQSVGVAHLEAARAIADYVWGSVDYILSRPWWGDPANPSDPAGMRGKVLEALKNGPMGRWDISSVVLGRHRTAKELNALRDLLIQSGEIRIEQVGRTETWRLA